MFIITSARLQGEVGISARSAMMPGEGASRQARTPHPNPLSAKLAARPRKNGARERAAGFAALRSCSNS